MRSEAEVRQHLQWLWESMHTLDDMDEDDRVASQFMWIALRWVMGEELSVEED